MPLTIGSSLSWNNEISCETWIMDKDASFSNTVSFPWVNIFPPFRLENHYITLLIQLGRAQQKFPANKRWLSIGFDSTVHATVGVLAPYGICGLLLDAHVVKTRHPGRHIVSDAVVAE